MRIKTDKIKIDSITRRSRSGDTSSSMWVAECFINNFDSIDIHENNNRFTIIINSDISYEIICDNSSEFVESLLKSEGRNIKLENILDGE